MFFESRQFESGRFWTPMSGMKFKRGRIVDFEKSYPLLISILNRLTPVLYRSQFYILFSLLKYVVNKGNLINFTNLTIFSEAINIVSFIPSF